MDRFPSKAAFFLALLVVTSGVTAGSLAAAKPAPLRISAPRTALQGKVAVVSVKTSSFVCMLSIRFSNGEKQTNLMPTKTAKGIVTWQWKVPDFAAAGQAKLSVACGAAKATKSVTVVGDLIPPRVKLLKQGFSPRVQGSFENVSYGLVLQNTSPNANALNVSVLVNFVLPDGHLIGTATNSIPIINAGSPFYVGGNIGFTGVPTISKLEVVINPGGRARSDRTLQPSLDNVHLVPDISDASWLGSVEGDIVNVHPTLTLSNASMSCVVFDANGNVIGGGNGSTFVKLLPATRAFFKLTNGLNAIAFNKAASVSVSVIPTYEQSATP
jgi:hypothetical protein